MEGRGSVRGTRTSVAAVAILTDLVLDPGTEAYAVKLACGCSFIVFDPPDTPPSVGAQAVCYSVDGNHIQYVPSRPSRLRDLTLRAKRFFSRRR
jgi:hypothetical protein